MHQTYPVNLSELIAPAYYLPWKSDCENILIKGSKGSGKSRFCALWIIYHMMKHTNANVLVIRKVFNTLKDSCFTDLKWAAKRLGVYNSWVFTSNPMQMTYIPTGTKIMFRGFDDPLRLASITVDTGYLCWVWFEEAYEIENYNDILKIQASIRGIPPESGLKKKFIFSFNPWSQYHFLKEEFFDKNRPNTLCMTTTYKDNPWLTEDDRRFLMELAEFNPKAARTIVYGDWGVSEGLIYENWDAVDFDPDEIAKREGIKSIYGLDFGYKISYNAFIAAYVDMKNHEIWIYDEMYDKGMTNLDIAKRITDMGYAKERIIADCAEPKSIDELRRGLIDKVTDSAGAVNYVNYILPRIEPAMKGKDSVSNGIARLQMFKIHIHRTRCVNTIGDFSSYAYKQDKKTGKFTGEPEKEHDHAPDAVRYAAMVLFRMGRGYVAEAKGIDGYIPKPRDSGNDGSRSTSTRRVYSTHE